MTESLRLFDLIHHQLEKHPLADCLAAKDNNGEWRKYSTQETIDLANKASLGLLSMGVKPGDKIGLISNNRPEWAIMDIAILQIGAVDVPIYATISEDDYRFIFNDAEIKFVFVSDEELLGKVRAIKKDVKSLEEIFTFNQINGASHWSNVVNKGKGRNEDELNKLRDAVKAEDLATLIYTSGTTGIPKGVMLSHKNITSNVEASMEKLPVRQNGKALSFLPICHIFERMISYLYTYVGVSIYYAESMDTIGDNIKEIKPEAFATVPRLLEKVYDKIIAKGAELTGIKRKLFFWSVETGLKYDPLKNQGLRYKIKLGIANALVFSKWREALGGNIKAIASGAAALQPRLARIFLAAKIPVQEGYGLTETSPVVSVNDQKSNGTMIGSVGRILNNVEVKIAEDGEILVKGPNVMMGYYKREDLTNEVISNGWFHTGDIGEMIDGVFLKITDRKKEMFKTSGGKYIAPQAMENKLKESRFIEQIMVVGNARKFPSALIVPSVEFVTEWANRKNLEYTNFQDLIKNRAIVKRITDEVEKFNKGFGSWERIKKIKILSEEWSVDTGELTPTLKLKRKIISEKYATQIEEIYAE